MISSKVHALMLGLKTRVTGANLDSHPVVTAEQTITTPACHTLHLAGYHLGSFGEPKPAMEVLLG